MRKRTKTVLIRFSEEEYEKFKEDVKRSQLFTQSYLRGLIKGERPTEKPDRDFFDYYRELRNIEKNLWQIAHKAYVLKLPEEAIYRNVEHGFHKQSVKILLQMLYTDAEDNEKMKKGGAYGEYD